MGCHTWWQSGPLLVVPYSYMVIATFWCAGSSDPCGGGPDASARWQVIRCFLTDLPDISSFPQLWHYRPNAEERTGQHPLYLLMPGTLGKHAANNVLSFRQSKSPPLIPFIYFMAFLLKLKYQHYQLMKLLSQFFKEKGTHSFAFYWLIFSGG